MALSPESLCMQALLQLAIKQDHGATIQLQLRLTCTKDKGVDALEV